MNPDDAPASIRDDVLIDACTALNLAASGVWSEVLEACKLAGVLVEAVAAETISIAHPDPSQDPVPVDLDALAQAGVVRIHTLDEQEVETWIELAAELGDGEAASLAVAIHRDWALATDDRKARKAHARLEVRGSLWTTARLINGWAEASGCDDAIVAAVLERIERQGRFSPGSDDPQQAWWQALMRSRGQLSA